MARVEGTCSCEEWGCTIHYRYDGKVAADSENRLPLDNKAGWVDAVTSKCRECEIAHGQRWGHNTAKAEEAEDLGSGERVI